MLLGAIALGEDPVDSITTSAPRCPSDVARVALREHLHALTVNHELVPSTTTSPGNAVQRVVAQRCAIISRSITSLSATHSSPPRLLRSAENALPIGEAVYPTVRIHILRAENY